MRITTDVETRLAALRDEATAALATAADITAITEWERAYLGPKGALTAFLRSLGGLSAEERPLAGRSANALKLDLTAAYDVARDQLAAVALDAQLAADAVDVTLPGRSPLLGGSHPVSQIIDELSEIFALLGYQTIFGPEVETGRYNFDMLNIPADHPARDVWDTFHLVADEELVLRTHTSPMQARTMERQPPPVRVVVPGKAFRFEAQDASHEWMFHQLEGLAVDQNITLTDLKGTLAEMARQLFGPQRKVRFRCDYFPFVEPGVDFAVDCAVCNGQGCRVCKQTGWLEMGGAGMVHPNVLRMAGYDPEQVSGFAFGLGIERIAMMRAGVDDVRAFAANDLRFLRQFAWVA